MTRPHEPTGRRPRPVRPESTHRISTGVPERPADIERVLRELGITPSRRWGQSFLADPFIADAEAALAGPTGPAGIAEIGGGLGILSAALLRRGWTGVTVIERDRRLAKFLVATLGDRIRVVVADALEVPLPPAECYVGNLPYSVATPILLRLFASGIPRIVFVVQREVAERLAAPAGSKAYGRLSITAQLYGTVELYRTIPPESFFPRPEVESRLATFDRRPGPIPVPSVPEFERVLRTLFSSRRKQLGNLLPRLVAGSAPAEALARAAGWPAQWSRLRPEDLPPSAYFALARALAVR